MLSRRQALKASAAAVAAAALAACGAPARQQVDPQPRRNLAASKADGRILFAKANTVDNGGKDDGIYALDNGVVRKLLAKGDGDDALEYPRWAPDGTQIAFVRAGDRGIFSDLWIVNADGLNPRRITDFQSKIAHKNDVNAEGKYVADSGIVAGVSWSRGGNFLTFASNKANPAAAMRPWTLEHPDQPPVQPANLHAIAATATFSPPGLFPARHIDTTALSPDGGAMAFSALWVQPDTPDNKQTQIYLLDIGPRKVSPPLTTLPWGAYDPAFSPDGQQIAFAGRPDYRVNDLFIMSRDGRNQTQITNTGTARAPVWSPDGKKLAFLAAFEGAQFNLYAKGGPIWSK